MNERVNKILLVEGEFMAKMYLRELGFSKNINYTQRKKEYKNLKKQEIHDIFIKTNDIKLAFNMI